MAAPADAETLGDVLARERRSDAPAARAAGDPTVRYSYDDLVTTAWKTAGFFRHRGVHAGARVAVVDAPAVPSVLALFGAAQLGAVTRFVPTSTRDGPAAESASGDEQASAGDGRPGPDELLAVDARLLVGPGEGVLDYDLPPGGTRLAYGPDVDDPTVESFGRSVWSENPVEAPETVDPGAAALETAAVTDDRAEPAEATDVDRHPHAVLLARARGVAADLGAGDDVVVRAPLARDGVVVAGVLAPLLAGATVVFPGEGTIGDVAVGGGDPPEQRVLDPTTV